jgi:hypothetical protein
MKKLNYIGLLFLSLLISGCVSVPSTTLRTPVGDFRFPKNVELEGLEITKSGTNLFISVKKYKEKNDANVISAAATGQAEIIKTSLEGGAVIAGEVAAKLK